MAARRPRPNYGGTSEQSIGKSPDADVAEPASTVGDTALPTLVSAPAPKSVFRRRLDSTWQLARKQCVSLGLWRPDTAGWASWDLASSPRSPTSTRGIGRRELGAKGCQS